MAEHSPLPLYVQIRDRLRRDILDGTYQVHERLPSEYEMMGVFGV
ncbi:MAG: GntR family transcriptional regulator, partial [Oleiphilaceae bacterium]|nr:GntR family transcriptional regulator [Oleiphilaceae bacterium]